MEVLLESDFEDHSEYRLLEVSKEWLQELHSKIAKNRSSIITPPDDDEKKEEEEGKEGKDEESIKKRVREGSTGDGRSSEDMTVAILACDRQTHFIDGTHTYAMRRIEYSNSLLIAESARDDQKKKKKPQEHSESGSTTENKKNDEELRSIVVKEKLGRLFEMSLTNPGKTAIHAILHKSYLTLEELEQHSLLQSLPNRETSLQSVKALADQFTFEDLTVLCCCSPRQLAEILNEMGAVTFHGRVRVLQPQLVYSALLALIPFLDAYTTEEMERNEDAAQSAVDLSTTTPASSSSVRRFICTSKWEDVYRHFAPHVFHPIVLDVVRATYQELNSPADFLLDAKKTIIGVAGAIIDSDAASSEGEDFGTSLTPSKVRVEVTQGDVKANTKQATTNRRADPQQMPKSVTYEFTSLPVESFYTAWCNKIPSYLFDACCSKSEKNGSANEAEGKTKPASPTGGVSQQMREEQLLERLKILEGQVVVVPLRQGTLQGSTVCWVPSTLLPEQVAQRLQVLFQLNPSRWSASALQAYIEPILEPGVKFSSIIARHAREYRVPGKPTTYTALV